MKKFICILLALTMLLTMTACGEKTSAEGSIKEGVCYEATGISPDAVAVTVDGVEIPMDVYFYFLSESAIYMEQFMSYYGMELDWTLELEDGVTVADLVKEEAQMSATQLAVIEKLVKEHKVELDAAATQELEDQRTAAVEQVGGEEQYLAIVAQMGLRPESYERIRRAQYLQLALQQAYMTEGSSLYADDAEILAYAEESGMMTADHILLGTLDDVTRQPLDEATVAARKAQAEDVLAKLRAYEGDDLYAYFGELGAEYSTDPGRALNPEGYTFGTGEMVTEFYDGAAALEVGEVSEIIESAYGYHIILRKELDTAKAVTAARAKYFAVFMDEVLAAAEAEANEALAALDAGAAYDAFLTAQGVTDTEEPSEESGEANASAAEDENAGEEEK